MTLEISAVEAVRIGGRFTKGNSKVGSRAAGRRRGRRFVTSSMTSSDLIRARDTTLRPIAERPVMDAPSDIQTIVPLATPEALHATALPMARCGLHGQTTRPTQPPSNWNGLAATWDLAANTKVIDLPGTSTIIKHLKPEGLISIPIDRDRQPISTRTLTNSHPAKTLSRITRSEAGHEGAYPCNPGIWTASVSNFIGRVVTYPPGEIRR